MIPPDRRSINALIDLLAGTIVEHHDAERAGDIERGITLDERIKKIMSEIDRMDPP